MDAGVCAGHSPRRGTKKAAPACRASWTSAETPATCPVPASVWARVRTTVIAAPQPSPIPAAPIVNAVTSPRAAVRLAVNSTSQQPVSVWDPLAKVPPSTLPTADANSMGSSLRPIAEASR